MKHIDIRRIDLNLLIAFEAIYQEGSVTGASERLYLTQSALSHALSRLRELCDDPLFERHGKIMVPTGMARQLIVPVQSALTLLERSLNQPYPAVSGKVRPRLTIGLISMYEAAFLPRLMARMAGEPDYEIAVTRYAPGKLEGHLAQGKFDVAIQMETPHSVHVHSTPLLRERLAVMARRGHPQAGEDIDLATYMAQYHVVVVPDERWTDFVSQEFQRLRLNRQVVLRCQDYWTAAQTVASSDFLLTAQRAALEQVLQSFPGNQLLPMPSDLDTPEAMEVRLYWHASRDEDPANRWLRQQLRAIFRKCSAAPRLSRAHPGGSGSA
ncbi:MAG: LysR family transcriptional regulator [Gammaproteobacteria bacterium]|jgi:DNA-binding transcriptional LysR family regulator|nr:LysR family transcriptional regulator [Gammaproteobacteria bacterium]MBK8994092.1 LysR family transcriptional regulator [Gammaproteobacteria bacterium]MBP7911760.1 LysR family transcriptional regulator [Pseudomonadales bacterium]